jgi:hypothetical protein
VKIAAAAGLVAAAALALAAQLGVADTIDEATGAHPTESWTVDTLTDGPCGPFLIAEDTPQELVTDLRRAGWTGRADDGADALYPPTCD